jgi:hypothetical protein
MSNFCFTYVQPAGRLPMAPVAVLLIQSGFVAPKAVLLAVQ